jgi:hypothetical protein
MSGMAEVHSSLADAAAALDEVVHQSDPGQRGAAADARIAVSQLRSAMGAPDTSDWVRENAEAGAGGARLHRALHRALGTLEVASQTGLSPRHKELLRRARIMVRAIHSEFTHPGTRYQRRRDE